MSIRPRYALERPISTRLSSWFGEVFPRYTRARGSRARDTFPKSGGERGGAKKQILFKIIMQRLMSAIALPASPPEPLSPIFAKSHLRSHAVAV